jgi:transposase-like protein
MAESTFRKLGKIQTESEAYAYMEGLRWPNGPVCPHCGNTEKHYYLKPRKTLTEGVESRKTRTGSHSERRVWKCANKECRKQFSVTTGTIFHGSKVPLVTWLMVVFEMCANKNGVAAREIARKYGVAPKTAWFMTQRIREAMKSNNLIPMVGTIVSDETWIGGDPTNDNHRKPKVDPVPFQPGTGIPNQRTDKTPVVSLINADTGEVRSQVVARVTGTTIRKFMAENVAMEASHLMTDEGAGYDTLGLEFGSHETVNHSAGEYARGSVSINKAENYFSQVKRSIDGTHHHISKEHLARYITEYDYRYSTCAMNDTQRMNHLMGQTERRISYKRVRGA